MLTRVSNFALMVAVALFFVFVFAELMLQDRLALRGFVENALIATSCSAGCLVVLRWMFAARVR